MYKPAGNPIVEELIKSWKRRSISLDKLNVIKIEQLEGKPIRKCAWCAETQLSHGNQKYCCNDCSESAMAWAYPQKEQGLGVLLVRQDYKCNVCQFDWMTPLNLILEKEYRRYPNTEKIDPKQGVVWYYISRLKDVCQQKDKPEVDHIIPVSNGGQSIGLSNHQALCFSCHKSKTKIDNSGPRKKNKL